MATKTITLTGAEVAVTGLDGAHAHIRNDSTDTIYAAKMPGITAGADGVASIPAGQADTLRGISGKVYLLGTGSAHIVSDDYVESPFKASTASGGSAVDEQARTALKAHENNAEIHVTADKKASWDGKAELTDIPATLPANGGNADTLDGFHANEIASNPNLLINPDFKINQRGQTEYTGTGYTVDHWWINNNTTTLTQISNGIKVSGTGGMIRQIIEEPERLAGKTVTASIFLDTIVGSGAVRLRVNGSFTGYLSNISKAGLASATFTLPEELTSLYFEFGMAGSNYCEYTILNAKLELGSVATPFTPPDPATELAKCQRYYQIRSTGDIDPVDLRPSMATIKDIKQRSDGNYEYIAEL